MDEQGVVLSGAVRDRLRWVVGLLLIAGLAVFGLSAFRESLAVYTHDYQVVQSRPGTLLQVPGVIARDLPQGYRAQSGQFAFAMRDVATQQQVLQVRTTQVKPANFDQARQVVCIGMYHDGIFEARQILVKCPSKEAAKASGVDGNAPGQP